MAIGIHRHRREIIAAGIFFAGQYDAYLAGADLDQVFDQARARFVFARFDDTDVAAVLKIAERILNGRAAVTDRVQ